MSIYPKDLLAIEAAKAVFAADPTIVDASENEQAEVLRKFIELYKTAWYEVDSAVEIEFSSVPQSKT